MLYNWYTLAYHNDVNKIMATTTKHFCLHINLFNMDLTFVFNHNAMTIQSL